MSILTYTADFREKDGELLSAPDVVDNFNDIKDAANSLDWMNIEDGSLDAFHLRGGESTKSVEGIYRGLRPVASGLVVEVAHVAFPVSVGAGVFAVCSLTYNGAGAGGIDSNPSEIELYATENPGVGIGMRRHTKCDNPEVHGHAGIVYAYQVGSPPSSGQHHVGVRLRLDPSSTISATSIPARGNLTVFVVHR